MDSITPKGLFSQFMEHITNYRYAPQAPPRSLTLREVSESYLESCRGRVKRSSCSTYATVAERHILPEFGERQICSLSAEELNSHLADISFGPEALSVSSVRVIVSVLRAIFRHAAETGLPVIPPDSIRRPPSPGRDTRILSPAEQQRLRDHLCFNTNNVKLGVLICLYTGLRIGEICALKWGDICVESSTINIRRTVQRIRNLDYDENGAGSRTMLIFDAPKSRAGARCIPIPSFLLEPIRLLRRAPECFVLTGEPERFMEPRVFQNRYRVILKRAGVDYVNFHALRHTFATNCVNLGFDVKSLSEILGHSDVSVTLNTYVHPSTSVKRAFMELLK